MKNQFLGKQMPAVLGLMVQAIFGIMGSQSLLHLGALSVRLSEGSLLLFYEWLITKFLSKITTNI